MKNGQSKLNLKPMPDLPEGQLLVSDVAKYLTGLAKLQDSDQTGNPALSAGLRAVAQALRPFAHCLAAELPEAIKRQKVPATGSKVVASEIKTEFPPETTAALESLSLAAVTQILDDPGSAKPLVAELGFRRFGLSRAALKRLSKQAARDAVRSALENERIIEVISREARKSGEARRS